MMESSGHVRVSNRLDDETDGDVARKEPFVLDRVEASNAGVAVHARRRRDGFCSGSLRRRQRIQPRVSTGRGVGIVFGPIRSCFDSGALLKQLFDLFIFVEQQDICQHSSVVVGQDVTSRPSRNRMTSWDRA